jgi:hypothetical protein
MFSSTSTSIILPDNFNIPQGITSLGDIAFGEMFASSNLLSLPFNFSFPSNLTTVGSSFAEYMFAGSKIKRTGSNVRNLLFPNVSSGDYYAWYAFSNTEFVNTSGISSSGAVTKGTNVPINRNS